MPPDTSTTNNADGCKWKLMIVIGRPWWVWSRRIGPPMALKLKSIGSKFYEWRASLRQIRPHFLSCYWKWNVGFFHDLPEMASPFLQLPQKFHSHPGLICTFSSQWTKTPPHRGQGQWPQPRDFLTLKKGTRCCCHYLLFLHYCKKIPISAVLKATLIRREKRKRKKN